MDREEAALLERIATALERIADNTEPATQKIGDRAYTTTIAHALHGIWQCMPEDR